MQHDRLSNVIRRNKWAQLKDAALTSSLLIGIAWCALQVSTAIAAV